MPITVFPDVSESDGVTVASEMLEVYEVTTDLNTGGVATTVDLNIPINRLIRGASALITTPVAGVSAAGVTATLDFAGGNTETIGTLVAAGDGNLPLNTEIEVIFDDLTTMLTAAALTDVTLTFSGGVDNTPSAGAIRVKVWCERAPVIN